MAERNHDLTDAIRASNCTVSRENNSCGVQLLLRALLI